MVDRVVEPDCIPVERRDLVVEGRAADSITVAIDLVEADRPDAVRQARQFRRPLGQPDANLRATVSRSNSRSWA